jgi:hypothetical protein
VRVGRCPFAVTVALCAIIEVDAICPYGYRRLFETLRSQSGEDIKIFSTVEDDPWTRWLLIGGLSLLGLVLAIGFLFLVAPPR